MFFWTVLFPGMETKEMTRFQVFTVYADHIAPGVIVGVDFALNRVPFKRKSLLLILPLLLIYGLVNLSVSLSTGHPVYPPIDPHRPLSYLIAACLPLAIALTFLFWEQVVAWKLKRYEAMEREQGITWRHHTYEAISTEGAISERCTKLLITSKSSQRSSTF